MTALLSVPSRPPQVYDTRGGGAGSLRPGKHLDQSPSRGQQRCREAAQLLLEAGSRLFNRRPERRFPRTTMFPTKPTGEGFMLTLAENFQTRAITLPKTSPPPPPPPPPAAESNSVLVLPPPWSLASYLGAGVKGGRSLPQGIPSLTHTHAREQQRRHGGD